MKYLFFFLLNAVAFSGCKKSNNFGNDTLPPITQEGKNSFGCLINGKLYVPKGFEQNKPNFSIYVSPTYYGSLDVQTFRKENGITQTLSFSCFGINGTGSFVLPGQINPGYTKDINSNVCCYTSSNNNYRSGNVNITRYDLTNGIISGTFEFRLYDDQISCDTIVITQGRFDKKLN
jgi:hypothetical protein